MAADAMIAKHPKRTATQAQKWLAKNEPALATLMDTWEAEQKATLAAWKTQQAATFAAWETQLGDVLDEAEFGYTTLADLEANKPGRPDLLAAEVTLAGEGWYLAERVGQLCAVVDEFDRLADWAVLELDRIERQARLNADRRQGRRILPRPPDDPDQQERERLYMAGLQDDDDDDPADTEPLRVIREQATTAEPAHGVWGYDWQDERQPEADTQKVWVPTWRAHTVRVAGWWRRTLGRATRAYARVAVGLLVAAGLSWGVG